MKSKPSVQLGTELLAIEGEWQRRLSRVRRLLRPTPSPEGRVTDEPMHRCQGCGRLQGAAETPSAACGRCDKLAADAWMETRR